MKKLIKIVMALVLVLIVAALIGARFFLGTAITKGFNAVGPTITKTDTRIDGASLSIFSGSGEMKGLFIGNPEGYKGAAMQVGSSSFAVKPSSIFSDKVVVKSVRIEGPELDLETDLKSINLKKLLNNVQQATGASGKETPKETPKETQPKEAQPTETQPTEATAKANKKVQVDEFVITGIKLHISLNAPIVGQKSATVPVPDVKLPPMGQGPDGVTVAEVSSVALQKLLEAAITEGEKVVSDMMKGGQFMGKDLGTNTTSTIQNATKGLGDLFKKK
jgi:hypothetical protein